MTRKAGQKRAPGRYLYDYDEVAAMLGYSPGYIKWLCDTKRLASTDGPHAFETFVIGTGPIPAAPPPPGSSSAMPDRWC